MEALLPEGMATEDAQQRGGVVLVPHPLGELDHVVPAFGLGVELGERDRGVGRRLELLDDVDRAVEVAVSCLSSASASPTASRLTGSSAVTPWASESSSRVKR